MRYSRTLLFKVKSLSCVRLFAIPWTVTYQAPQATVHGVFQARVLEWVAVSFSRGIFLTQGLNLGLLNCRQMLYHLSHREALLLKSLIKYLSAFLSIYLVA